MKEMDWKGARRRPVVGWILAQIVGPSDHPGLTEWLSVEIRASVEIP